MSRNYWIIDTDAGVDDCQALILALKSPEIEVLAITTVAGNVGLQQVIKNTAETLKACEVSIPFYKGSEKPLINELATAKNIHGSDGLNNYWENRQSENQLQPENKSAVQAILDYANLYPGEINIVTIGPLTNLALAVSIDPNLPQKFKRVLVMGGAVHAEGNRKITSEFNVWCDPEAAYIVFDRFPCIELLPWETCTAPEHQFTLEFLNRYLAGKTKAGEFVSNITKIHEGRSSVFFCDPVAMAIAVDPTIVKKSSVREGYVELSGNLTRGMTIINWRQCDVREFIKEVKQPNIKIIESIDMEKVMDLFIRSIS
jgi:purine nucleosidase